METVLKSAAARRLPSVVLLLLVFLGMVAMATSGTLAVNNVRENRKLSIFRPLRRVVRNFVNERQAFITIVFQRAKTMPNMRWFRQVKPKSLPNAELPDMINIDGDPRYRVRRLSSHDVTAVTLIIQPLAVDSFPVKFVTCFSYNDDPFQYQLDTVIHEPTERSNQQLDGIIWLRAPPPHISFSPELTVHCAITMESESSRFTDELNAYRSYVDRKRFKNGSLSGPRLLSAGYGKMHKDRQNYAEAGGKYISQGRREETNPGQRTNVLYDVSFQVLNGSEEDVGAYTCAGERERDRTYISAWVTSTRVPPVMLFQPCEDVIAPTTFNTHSPNSPLSYQVRITEGQPTCVRCRVYDRQLARIHLTKNNIAVLRSDNFLQLDEHLNVADGGLSELTLTFLQPSITSDVAGQYKCSVAHGAGAVSVEFRIFVERP